MECPGLSVCGGDGAECAECAERDESHENVIASCDRNGKIVIEKTLSDGLVPLIAGARMDVEEAVQAIAIHGYNGKTYYVSGCATTDSDDEAMAAVEAFIAHAKETYPGKFK